MRRAATGMLARVDQQHAATAVHTRTHHACPGAASLGHPSVLSVAGSAPPRASDHQHSTGGSSCGLPAALLDAASGRLLP
jgi:hypothetical protein